MPDTSNPAPPSTADLALFGSRIASAALSRAITSPFLSRKNKAPEYLRDVLYTTIHAMLASLTIAQSRYLNKSTSEQYLDLCKRIKQAPRSIELDAGVKAHWIGEESADVVMLYLHGGGYTQPVAAVHLQYFHRLIVDMNQAGGNSVSILLLAYTLAPEATFPTQLREAASALSYLLFKAKRSARDLILVGDSAGGGLALSLLSHLRHPHPGVPEVKINATLRAALLMSPWVSFDTTHESYVRNVCKDTLVPLAERKWAAMYLDTAKGEEDPGIVRGDRYTEPLLAENDWWEGTHEIVEEVMIWGGSDEVFIDSIRLFADRFLEGWKKGGGVAGRVRLEVGEDNAHEGPIMDVVMDAKKKSVYQWGIEEWLKERLEQ